MTTPTPAPTITLPSRDNSQARAVTLGSGTFVVGSDIQPGRYAITALNGEWAVVSVNRGSSPLPPFVGDVAPGMSFTVSLLSGDEVKVSVGATNPATQVVFTPVETPMTIQLTAGQWIVGLDIAPGRYIVTAPPGESGNFTVFHFADNGTLTGDGVNTILGERDLSVTVTLESGDEIRIDGVSAAIFTLA